MARVSDAVELGRLARRRRREQRATQQNLADVCRVGRGSVAKLERGEANIELGITLRLVQALGLNVEVVPRSASVAMTAAEVAEVVEHDRAVDRARSESPPAAREPEHERAGASGRGWSEGAAP